MTVSRQGPDTGASSPHAHGNRRDGRSRAQPSDPRANQRERTRAAIMEGARKLLLMGKVPSIADAAHEARVSRATAYRYFPTQGALIQEAVNAVLIPPGEWDERLEGPGGLTGRVGRLTSTVVALIPENEALQRGALLLSLQQWARAQAGEDIGEEPIKRGGRLTGIHAALKPYDGELDAAALRRLAIAISLVIGIEARIVLRDIWKLDDDEAEQVTQWIVRTVAQATAEQKSEA